MLIAFEMLTCDLSIVICFGFIISEIVGTLEIISLSLIPKALLFPIDLWPFNYPVNTSVEKELT